MAETLSGHPRYGYEAVEEPSQVIGEPARAPEVAEYLGDILGQLEGMARSAGLDLLSYLLSMARVEAEGNARAGGDRRRPPWE